MTTRQDADMLTKSRIRESVVVAAAMAVVLMGVQAVDRIIGSGAILQPRPIVMAATTQSHGSMAYVFMRADCPYCKALRPSVQRLVREGYPIAEMDIATPLGSQAIQALRITQVPTLAIFDPDGRDPNQLIFRRTTLPEVVLRDSELRALLRRENITPRVAVNKQGG